MTILRNAAPALAVAFLTVYGCAPAPDKVDLAPETAACDAVGGEYEVIAMRRASDVIGGPVDASVSDHDLGDKVSLAEELNWLGDEYCPVWSVSELQTTAANLDDPLLADVIIGPNGGLLSEGERGAIKHFELLCDEATIGALTRIDDRVLVAPSASGLTYVILEKPLPTRDISVAQQTLKDRGFYDGDINGEMDEATQNAVSRYASSRGGYNVVFARSALTRNLLGSLGLASSNACAEPAADGVEARFPDYTPKLGEDTVLDYRPGLAPRLNELPSVTRENFQVVYVTLGDLMRDALSQPGHWEDGNIALGADPQEYVPSDEELLAAEFGDRLAALVKTMSPEDIMDAWDGAAVVPPSVTYNRFNYRHVDVMGSGRFFYASAPQEATIDIPPRPGTP